MALKDKRKRSRRVRRGRPKVNRAFAKRVRQVMMRVAEKKVQTYTNNSVTPFCLQNTTASIGNNVFPLTPYTGNWVLSQGTGQGARVGNRVRTQHAMLAINMTALPYNATTNTVPKPYYVKIWFCKNKQNPTVLPTLAQICVTATANFMQVGSTDQGLVGTFYDLQNMVNRDSYIVYGQRTFKIGPAYYAGTGAAADSGNYSSNDFKLSVLRRMNITKYLPKYLDFDDNLGTTESACHYMLIQLVASNGATIAANQNPINFGFTLTYQYTDV